MRYLGRSEVPGSLAVPSVNFFDAVRGSARVSRRGGGVARRVAAWAWCSGRPGRREDSLRRSWTGGEEGLLDFLGLGTGCRFAVGAREFC